MRTIRKEELCTFIYQDGVKVRMDLCFLEAIDKAKEHNKSHSHRIVEVWNEDETSIRIL